MKNFYCSQCKEEKPRQTIGGTGYAIKGNGHKICYQCCAIIDRQEMIEEGKIVLYHMPADGSKPWNHGKITNWPGTLSFPVSGSSKSFHNFAGKDGRTDFWFKGPDGHIWHGYQIGHYNQIAHCKRTKEVHEGKRISGINF